MGAPAVFFACDTMLPGVCHRIMLSNIALIGFMGTGKSTIGRALARRLDWQFIDTDLVIERIAGYDIPTLFVQQGEDAFREHEARAILGLSLGERQVIATGGGAILRDENTAALRGAGLVVLLTARPDVIVSRVSRRPGQRPLLASEEQPLARVLRLLAERGPLYQRAAHCIIDTSDRPPLAVVEEIMRSVRRWSA